MTPNEIDDLIESNPDRTLQDAKLDLAAVEGYLEMDEFINNGGNHES